MLLKATTSDKLIPLLLSWFKSDRDQDWGSPGSNSLDDFGANHSAKVGRHGSLFVAVEISKGVIAPERQHHLWKRNCCEDEVEEWKKQLYSNDVSVLICYSKQNGT